MKISLLFAVLFFSAAVQAQVPVVAETDHERLLASADATLAANKRLVYDFQREVLEAGHLNLAEKYLSEDYIQHNPMVPTGRAGFVAFFSQFSKATPIAARVSTPLVHLSAEGDIVVMATLVEKKDPKVPGATYTTTWFDMFRVKNGKLVEHWDPMTKR